MALLSRLNALFDSNKVRLPAEPGVAPAVSGEGAFGTGDEFTAEDAAVHLEDEEVVFVADDTPFERIFGEEDLGSSGRTSIDLIDGSFEGFLRCQIKSDTGDSRNNKKNESGS